MIVNLPKVEKVWDDEQNKIIPKHSTVQVRINNSVLAHLKWEQQFEDVEKMDLLVAIERVQATALKSKDVSDLNKHLTLMLRVLFCFIDSDDFESFAEFAMLFGDNPIPIMEKLKIVLTENAKVSSKN